MQPEPDEERTPTFRCRIRPTTYPECCLKLGSQMLTWYLPWKAVRKNFVWPYILLFHCCSMLCHAFLLSTGFGKRLPLFVRLSPYCLLCMCLYICTCAIPLLLAQHKENASLRFSLPYTSCFECALKQSKNCVSTNTLHLCNPFVTLLQHGSRTFSCPACKTNLSSGHPYHLCHLFLLYFDFELIAETLAFSQPASASKGTRKEESEFCVPKATSSSFPSQALTSCRNGDIPESCSCCRMFFMVPTGVMQLSTTSSSTCHRLLQSAKLTPCNNLRDEVRNES